MTSCVAVILAVSVALPYGDDMINLTGNLTRTDTHLVIDYRLSNAGSKSVYVWDVMINYDTDGQFIDDDIAYVFWEDPKAVRLVRALLDEPPDVHVVAREMPYVRELAPKAHVTGRVSLALPVKENSPFYPPTSELQGVECSKVRLIVGWIDRQAGMVLSPREVRGRKVLALRGSWPRPPQRLASVVFDSPLKLQVRTDKFDRRLPPHE